jgi:hypothetical protein
MTVNQLRELLPRFPPDLPVFVCARMDQLAVDHPVIAPQDAVMNLVERDRLVAMGIHSDGDVGQRVDAVVIYPLAVRQID